MSTLVIRHRKENLSKCSLRGLESRPEFKFLIYPLKDTLVCENPVLLTFDAPLLSCDDQDATLVIIDGTWKYAMRMEQNIQWPLTLKRRGLPLEIRTAYPRCQHECPCPERGLASVEAIYVAYLLLGRNPCGLLNHYYWKEKFLEINHLT